MAHVSVLENTDKVELRKREKKKGEREKENKKRRGKVGKTERCESMKNFIKVVKTFSLPQFMIQSRKKQTNPIPFILSVQ